MEKPVDYNNVIATQLFHDLQASKGDLKVVPSVFEKFTKAMRSIPRAEDILEHPFVADKRRHEFIEALVKHFGGDKAMADALFRINADFKYAEIPDILKQFGKLSSDVLKETIATVTTAEPLSKEAMKTIEKGLMAHVKKGYKLTLVEKVEPTLLAGFIIDMDDMNQDLSLSSYIANVDKMIAKAIETAKI